MNELESLVILWSTTADPSRAARLHKQTCAMVNAGKGKSGKMRAFPADQATVNDLNERGFPVKRCKCCK